MNCFRTLSLVLLGLIVSVTSLAALADVDGFKGMRWGSALNDLQRTKQLVLTKETDANGETLYALQNEDLRFGKATLSGISCTFTHQRLQGVILLFAGNKNFAAMKTEAFARFGDRKKIEQNGEEMYSWTGDISSIVLSYNKGSESGFLFMKAKKPVAAVAPPQARTEQPGEADTRQTERPEEQETALDRASLPQEDAPPQAPPGSPSAQAVGSSGGWQAAPAPSPGEDSARIVAISPEIQALIDRDQDLTHLCWDTVGPTADDACRQMRVNAQRLQDLGWCMTPGDSATTGSGVIWGRCQPSSAALQAPSLQETKPAGPSGRESLCRTVGEMFTTTAWMRDDGETPQAAEQALLRYENSQGGRIGIEHIRETVELVYFDPEYSSVWGTQIAQQVEDDCLSGFGPFNQPLFP